MSGFVLDPVLARDTFALDLLDGCQVRLMDNAAVTWLVLVPDTDAVELVDLDRPARTRLWRALARCSRFLREVCEADKLNVAAVGNVVSQLHVHVVARRATNAGRRPANGPVADAREHQGGQRSGHPARLSRAGPAGRCLGRRS